MMRVRAAIQRMANCVIQLDQHFKHFKHFDRSTTAAAVSARLVDAQLSDWLKNG